MFAIITENDLSQWDDITGEVYHFPNKYLKILLPGTRVIYYNGKLKDKKFSDKRLSSEPHYFGTAVIGKVSSDKANPKKRFFAEIRDFKQFQTPVLIKVNGQYVENIKESKKTSHWRDGVRKIDSKIFEKILNLAGGYWELNETNTNEVFEPELTSYSDGAKKLVFTTRYERTEENRNAAIRFHGCTCLGCGFNFEKQFGEFGKGFIHVHHIKPLSGTGEMKIDPKKDLIVLCPNCHAMVHYKKDHTLTLEELKDLIRRNA